MTVSRSRQNLSRELSSLEIDIYDDKGRFDPVASHEANKEIFSETNVVKLPGGGIDHTATLSKVVAARVVVASRKK